MGDCADVSSGSMAVVDGDREEFDDVFDAAEFAIGLEVVVGEGFAEWNVFDGAIFHEKEDGFVASGLAETAGENIDNFSVVGAEVSEAFGASFIGGKSIDFFGDIPVEREGADTIFEVPVEVDR